MCTGLYFIFLPLEIKPIFVQLLTSFGIYRNKFCHLYYLKYTAYSTESVIILITIYVIIFNNNFRRYLMERLTLINTLCEFVINIQAIARMFLTYSTLFLLYNFIEAMVEYIYPSQSQELFCMIAEILQTNFDGIV